LTNEKILGGWGEARALDLLLERGYTLIQTQYTSRYGEIDIIVCDDEFVVFVEVKLRRDDKFGQAREFVSPAKQRRVRATAQMWLVANETELQPRFDVIEIYAPQGVKTAKPVINHLENAF
jgi:putative endonuclease